MKWEEVDRARYERGVQSGWAAERTVAEALRDGIGEIHTIRLIRALLGIDLVEAKELLVRVESGSNLVEHQETLLPALRRAFGGGDGSDSQSSEEREGASPESYQSPRAAAGSIESDILNNNFISRLRNEVVLDRVEYDHLVDQLRQLAIQWRGQKLVDKAVVQELYVLAPMTKNIADSLRDHAPDRAAEISSLAIELDALVLECLAD